jgi:hypothetical protein
VLIRAFLVGARTQIASRARAFGVLHLLGCRDVVPMRGVDRPSIAEPAYHGTKDRRKEKPLPNVSITRRSDVVLTCFKTNLRAS